MSEYKLVTSKQLSYTTSSEVADKLSEPLEGDKEMGELNRHPLEGSSANPEFLKYLSSEQINNYRKVFDQLGLPTDSQYAGANEFSRHIQQAGILQYEGVEFRMSNSSSVRFPK